MISDKFSCANIWEPWFDSLTSKDSNVVVISVLMYIIYYSAFDIFQKIVFCMLLYSEKVNLQSFVMV